MSEKKKILIIDDEQDLTFLMSEALSLNDECEVFVANDGLEGQEMSAKVKPDVVFLDFVMPKVKGDKVLQYIHDTVGREKKVDVVIMSGMGQEVYLQENDRRDSTVIHIQKEQQKQSGADQTLTSFPGHVIEKYGVRYFLSKPFSQEELLNLTKKIFNA